MPNVGHQARRTAGATQERTLFAVACSRLILIEAPSSAYHVVGWRWANSNNLKRRRPHEILHQAAPVLWWDRLARPHHVPLRLKPGGRSPGPPEHEGSS